MGIGGHGTYAVLTNVKKIRMRERRRAVDATGLEAIIDLEAAC